MNTTAPPAPAATSQDEEHLKLLSIFYFIYGGLSILGSCFGIVYVGIFGAMMASPEMSQSGMSADEAAAMRMFGTAGIVIGVVACIVGIAISALYLVAGKNLRQHKGYILTLVLAGLACLSFPLGTALGVFTFVVLCRDSVKRLYGRSV